MLAFRAIRTAIAILAGPALLAACADPPPLYVDQAYIKVSPNADSPSAGYFVVHGGGTDSELRDVITDRALRVEMHESVMKDGKMGMERIEKVAVPAGQQVAFAPGGKHLMLWGINSGAVEQGKMPLTFLFSNGDRIIVDAVIQKAGSAAPAPAPGPAPASHDGKEHKD